jgi:hypothetical protein
MNEDNKTLITILGFLLLLFLMFCLFTKCSYEVDNNYDRNPPDSIIGTSCNNGLTKYEWGDYYYCTECIDGILYEDEYCQKWQEEE